jgi:hypothetical protein
MSERAERLRREVWRWLRLGREETAGRVLERAAQAATQLVGADPDEQAGQP